MSTPRDPYCSCTRGKAFAFGRWAAMNEEEVFLVIFRVRPGPTPARSRINRLLKYAGAWGIECLGFGDPAELARLRQEVIALRARLSAADSCPQKEDLP